jgi:serine protease inhibitor
MLHAFFARRIRVVGDQPAKRRRLLRVERLEDRRMLDGRAADAVNAFALDVFAQMQREHGNLFFSPLSVATSLAMTYAGAAGQTAAEMEKVLHSARRRGSTIRSPRS